MSMNENLSDIEAFKIMYCSHTEQLRILKRSLKDSVQGKLMISREKGKPVFYRVSCENGNYSRKRICGKEQLIYKLANKRYREELARRKAYNNQLFSRISDRLLPEDPQSVIAALPKGFEYLDFARIADPHVRNKLWPNPSRDDMIFPERARLAVDYLTPEDWAAKSYCENTKELHNKTHRSRRGICCRSKGEAMLLDLADDMNLMYRYDSVITIDGMEISPDLIIIRPDGRLIYVEHHGWINREDGDRAFLRKLELYSRRGIIQGYNLLVTFDRPDGSCDTELIRRQLKNMLSFA